MLASLEKVFLDFCTVLLVASVTVTNKGARARGVSGRVAKQWSSPLKRTKTCLTEDTSRWGEKMEP